VWHSTVTLFNICFYREGEFLIDKAKAQLPGCSLPPELPIILLESIPFVRFLTDFMVFLTNVLCLQAVPLRFSSQRQRHYYIVLGLDFEFGTPFHVGLRDFDLARNSPLWTDC
jgi:hypothetical protein